MNAVGTAATAMRAKLGESRSSIQKLNRPLEQATTRSLEALQNYTAGHAEMVQGDFWLLFRCLSAPSRSIRISRWLTTSLAIAFEQCRGHGARAEDMRSRLSRLIDRVSEYERDYIAATLLRGDWRVGQSD